MPLERSTARQFFTAFIAGCVVITTLGGCVPSPKPAISPNSSVKPPEFDGNPSKITVATQKTKLTGTCSADVDGLQYSVDSGKTWNDIPGGCTQAGKFELSVFIPRVLNVSVRAKVKVVFSDAVSVQVTFIPPPTTQMFSLVAASASGKDTYPNVQSVIGLNYSGQALSAGTKKIETYLPGMIYGLP